ncbi:unnamed protein product [Closterium sp. Yama58-4]|nr:unnamed protein product [Closterium sp. Yama58-4]
MARCVAQEVYAAHAGPITRCRFSPSGANIASASADGSISPPFPFPTSMSPRLPSPLNSLIIHCRIWEPEISVGAAEGRGDAGVVVRGQRDAAILGDAPVQALEWDAKSDRLLLAGLADGHVKVWNAHSKHMLSDAPHPQPYTRLLDIRSSPSEHLFACAAAAFDHPHHSPPLTSSLQPTPLRASLARQPLPPPAPHGCISLWSLRTMSLQGYLPLGESPPLITSICLNHNGRMLAAAAADGTLRLFDVNAASQIACWPVTLPGSSPSSSSSSSSSHLLSPAVCVRFLWDHSSLFSLSASGQVRSLLRFSLPPLLPSSASPFLRFSLPPLLPSSASPFLRFSLPPLLPSSASPFLRYSSPLPPACLPLRLHSLCSFAPPASSLPPNHCLYFVSAHKLVPSEVWCGVCQFSMLFLLLSPPSRPSPPIPPSLPSVPCFHR